MADDDFHIPPVNMAQSMSIAATTVHALIAMTFIDPADSEEEKVAKTYVCLAVFFHQLCMPAKHKDKMIGVLEAIVTELKEAS